MKLPIQKCSRTISNLTDDKQVLRAAIIAEQDAIMLYEQLANNTSNEDIRMILLDIAKEEKVHVGEFQSLLNMVDGEFDETIKEGAKEVEEKL